MTFAEACRLNRSRGPVALALATAFLLLSGTMAPVWAQYNEPPAPAAWALSNVTVMQADGTVAEGLTLVVRDGVIEAMGTDVAAPAGARLVEWEEGTLHVYPGLVDAEGNGSVDWPQASREGVQSWNPTREVQRFTPHRPASDFLSDAGSDFEDQRKAGVVASVLLPPPGLMSGQASLLLHRMDARTPRELVLEPSLAVVMAFQGAPGAYPGTLMAQQAFMRQAFLDARHYRDHRANNGGVAPRGMASPTYDADFELLNQMMDGEVPVYFRVNSAEDIRRVLALVDEFGLDVTLVGGREAGVLADELAARGIRVFLNAYMPRPDDWDPEDPDAEITPAGHRERERLLRAWETPGQLQAAGVDFVFTSGGTGGGPNMLAGVRRAIEYGLDEAEALQALSARPARHFGLDHLVRVEEGGPATFLVTDGPLLEDGRGIVWTFVNGRAEEGRTPVVPGEEPEADGVDEEMAEALAGTWEGQASAQGQEFPLQLVFEWDGTEMTGEVAIGDGGTQPLDNLQVTSEGVRFSVSPPQFQGASMEFSGAPDGDRMEGSASIVSPVGEFSITFNLARVPGSMEVGR